MLFTSIVGSYGQNYLFVDSIKKIYSECFAKKDFANSHRAEAELSFTGKLKEAQILYNFHGSENRKFPAADLEKFDSSRFINWLTPIADSAPKYKVIMMNEPHHNPLQRINTFSLLDTLYHFGYRYLGCEAISCLSTEELNKRKYVLFEDGYYLKEPVFANFVNYALKKGFYVFGYDCNDHDNRELSQAIHIADILKRDSAARIILHVGWGHLREDTTAKVMAYQLSKLMHIDPLTINQTRMQEQSTKDHENPIYQTLNFFDDARFYFEKYSNSLYHDTWTDLILFQPRIKYLNQRPIFLSKNDHLFKYKLNTKKLKNRKAIVTVSYNKDKNAVPTDVFEVDDFENDITLFSLCKGNNVVTIVYRNGSTEKFTAKFK